MKLRRVTLAFLLGIAEVLASCGGDPCRAQSDCSVGFYCVLDVSGARPQGTCEQDCATDVDCAIGDPELTVTTCNDQGRCLTSPRPPTLKVLEPIDGATFPEGTRTVRILGEVESAAQSISVTVSSINRNGCGNGPSRSIVLENSEAGRFVRQPFAFSDVEIDPGTSVLEVRADISGADMSTTMTVDVPCPGCAAIHLDSPIGSGSVEGLELLNLEGSVSPPTITSAVWRVYGAMGGVFDGVLDIRTGRFQRDRLPLFSGLNRIAVVVTGVGSGLGETRCSAVVSSARAKENGVRTVLSWTGSETDLDLHVVGPGGRYADPGTSLFHAGRDPFFGGTLLDDLEGYGPEVAQVEKPPFGVYGLAVEPVYDESEVGSDAFVRVLFDGRLLSRGAIGPQHLSPLVGEIWIVGTVVVDESGANFVLLDDLVPASAPPTSPPSSWPSYYF